MLPSNFWQLSQAERIQWLVRKRAELLSYWSTSNPDLLDINRWLSDEIRSSPQFQKAMESYMGKDQRVMKNYIGSS